jgi:hypothetical protein
MLRLFVASAGLDRLGAATDFLKGFPPATEVLVVAGNRGAADDVVRSLAKAQVATFGFHRFSLTQLAFRVAAGELALRGLTHVSPLAAQASAAHVAYQLASKDELPYFGSVSSYPGFAPSLAATLQQLRLARVAALSSSTDLAALLAAYNEELAENSFSDASVLFDLATESLRRKPITSPLLLLDIRTESKAQREFVRALIAGSINVFATVHTADEPSQHFYQSLPCDEILLAQQRSAASSLERLRANLFSPEPSPAADFDESVVVF